jgi:hypothetical protein
VVNKKKRNSPENCAYFHKEQAGIGSYLLEEDRERELERWIGNFWMVGLRYPVEEAI